MGEVGANATETTAPADSNSTISTSASNSEPKENGEVNGGTDATVTVKGVSTASEGAEPKEDEQKETKKEKKQSKNGTSDAEQDATVDEADSPGTALTSIKEESDAKQSQQATTEARVTEGTEKSDCTSAPSAEQKSSKADDDEAEASDGGDDDVRADQSSPAAGDTDSGAEKSTSAQDTARKNKVSDDKDVPAVEAMEVDADSDTEEVRNGTSNGGAVAEKRKEVEKVAAGNKEDSKSKTATSAKEVTEIEDEDEPMEVDGDGSREPAAATNGHKEPNASNEGEVTAVDERRPSEKPQTGSKPATTTNDTEKKNRAENDEDDDDKPVSINSDSESDEGEQQQQQQDSSAVKPAAKAANVILVNEGGLAKLGEAGTTAAAAGADAKSSDSSSKPSNGVAIASSNQQNGDCDGDLTILSDKEDDCVVIEDDDGDSDASMPSSANTSANSNNNSLRNSSSIRSRRSVAGGSAATLMAGGMNSIAMAAALQQQQQQQQQQGIVSSMEDDDDDDDDDIEEIIDDPLSLNTVTNLSMSGGRNSLAGGYQGKGQGQKSLLMNSGTGGTGGKEPTLVIIDTNTIMNNIGTNRGVASPGGVNNAAAAASLLAKAGSAGILPNVNSTASQFNSRSLLNSPGVGNVSTGGTMLGNPGGMLGKGVNTAAMAPVTPLLPALTDDMFVLEAPSFIVPYIYEKPPVDNLRDIVDELEVKIKEMRKKLEESGAVLPATKSQGDTALNLLGVGGKEDEKKDTTASMDAAGDKDSDRNKYNKKRKRNNDDDDDWDELETSTDDEASDEEQKTKVLIKEAKADIEAIKEHIISPADKDDLGGGGSNDPKKSENYFENPLGKFFMNIGINLVQEFVQTDLLRQQKRKRDREGKPSPSTQLAINSLMKNLEQSKENNKPYKFEMKRCEYCPFKSESALVMAHHYETPHMRNFIYKCNFCAYETRPPHDILYHMEAVHNIKGRMEKALSYHHCPNCPFEDNGKSKLARHAVACAKKFRPELNLNPPIDWEPPAKIPRIKPKHGLVGTATAYQAMTAQQQKNIALANQQRLNQQQQVVSSPMNLQQQQQHLTQLQQQQLAAAAAAAAAAAGQQHLGTNAAVGALNNVNLANLSPAAQAVAIRARAAGVGGAGGGAGGVGVGGRAPAIIPSPTGITGAGGMRSGGGGGGGGGGAGGVGMNANALAASAAAIRNTLAGAGMVIPNNFQLTASALAAAAAGGFSKYLPNASSMKATKTVQPPSISITPLPRQSASNNNSAAANMSNIAGALSKLQAQGTSAVKPGQNPSGGKTAFVVCEICDGYIKDLDQLRNHMQWIHKVKIHPKMIYNRPPLNCQKCQYRFFTDQGLERHLLGSHGLVTSSMQEAANKGKDAGRCPVCGRVYQWKLLNHVSRDHNMTLKPAHLSYKCTVCTATFGMYKQFESHVYSAHSTVAKKTADGKTGKSGGGGGQQQQSSSGMGGGSSSSGGGLRSPFVGGGDSLLKPLKINDEITIIPQPTSNSSKMSKTIELESHVID
uniref:MOG interacting and ectopic P-granules protein 1 n=1 Tax=Anopheles dirus TaxID=7168 RepID=A0A182NIA5_9DIPT